LSKARVDYDQIAPRYNRRFADDKSGAELVQVLQALVEQAGAQRCLEVGCGTGHWLAALAAAPGQCCHGLDFSAGMLQQARQREQPLDLARGRASQLPYRDASFDLIYCLNAIHHFERPQAFVFEARRLLRPGGALAVIGFDPHTLPGQWYIYDYFEDTLEADLARFPSWGRVLNWMLAAGLQRIEWRLARRIHDPKIGAAVWDDPFLAKGACSQLALLSDEAYQAGRRRIEAALARAQASGEQLTFAVDLFVGLLVGWLPEPAGQPGRRDGKDQR